MRNLGPDEVNKGHLNFFQTILPKIYQRLKLLNPSISIYIHITWEGYGKTPNCKDGDSPNQYINWIQ